MPATRRRACSGSTIGISGSESGSGLCSLFCIVYTSIARLMSFELMLWANTKSKANMTYVRLTQRVRCTLATIATGRTEVNFRFPFQSLPDTSQILSLRQRYKILPEMHLLSLQSFTRLYSIVITFKMSKLCLFWALDLVIP